MIYDNTVTGSFVYRKNRFEAVVKIDGREETVHVKNTGRCREILLPGTKVILSAADNPHRKTGYDLIAAYKKNTGIINIDSMLPNRVVYEWLSNRNCDFIKPEYTYGKSRLDFYVEKNNRKILAEVKGCTLEKEGTGYFPDAPTVRGRKHLYELIDAVASGYEAYLIFVIPVNGVYEVLPCGEIDKDFEYAYNLSIEKGVKIIFLPCDVTENSVTVKKGIISDL